LDYVISAGLTQCVDFCTRGRNTIDVVFTDDDQLVNSVVADETFGDSDHDTVKFVIVLEPTDNQTHVLADDTRFVWSKANFRLIDSYLSSIDWQLVLQNNPEALQFWSAVEWTIYDAVEIAVPKQTTPAYHSSMRRIPKKYPRIIRKLRVKKRYLWRQLRTDKNSSALRTEYKNCVNEWREQLRNYDKQSEVKARSHIRCAALCCAARCCALLRVAVSGDSCAVRCCAVRCCELRFEALLRVFLL